MIIQEAFRANDVEFAQSMVNVGGDEKDGGAAAAVSLNVRQAAAMPETSNSDN